MQLCLVFFSPIQRREMFDEFDDDEDLRKQFLPTTVHVVPKPPRWRAPPAMTVHPEPAIAPAAPAPRGAATDEPQVYRGGNSLGNRDAVNAQFATRMAAAVAASAKTQCAPEPQVSLYGQDPHSGVWVPPVVDEQHIDNNVRWSPAKQRPAKTSDISIADVVTVEPRAPVTLPPHENLALRRIVASDDGDPFAFPTRCLPPPPAWAPRHCALESDSASSRRDDDAGAAAAPARHIVGVTLPTEPRRLKQAIPAALPAFGERDLVETPSKVMLMAHDRRHVFCFRPAAPQEGWSSIKLRGPQPPPRCLVVAYGQQHALAVYKKTVHVLHLNGMTWRASSVLAYTMFMTDAVWAHQAAKGLYYARDAAGGHVLMEVAESAHDRQAHLHFRGRALHAKPAEEQLTAVVNAPGLALSFLRTHTWVYRFSEQAYKYIPHCRVEFVTPLPAVIDCKKLWLFAELKPGSGTSTVVGTLDLETLELTGPPRHGDVMLQLPRAETAVAVGAQHNCVVVVSTDLVRYVVMEVDRWAKILTHTKHSDAYY
jgi:hypothetical protein